MVHWLTYPTELGEQPDAIEYLGKVTYLFKKDVYYIFRFRSDSKNLDDELRGQWLIGKRRSLTAFWAFMKAVG